MAVGCGTDCSVSKLLAVDQTKLYFGCYLS